MVPYSLANESISVKSFCLPVLVTFLAILAIGTWIGWAMATTPPNPIREIETQKGTEESGT